MSVQITFLQEKRELNWLNKIYRLHNYLKGWVIWREYGLCVIHTIYRLKILYKILNWSMAVDIIIGFKGWVTIKHELFFYLPKVIHGKRDPWPEICLQPHVLGRFWLTILGHVLWITFWDNFWKLYFEVTLLSSKNKFIFTRCQMESYQMLTYRTFCCKIVTQRIYSKSLHKNLTGKRDQKNVAQNRDP